MRYAQEKVIWLTNSLQLQRVVQGKGYKPSKHTSPLLCKHIATFAPSLATSLTMSSTRATFADRGCAPAPGIPSLFLATRIGNLSPAQNCHFSQNLIKLFAQPLIHFLSHGILLCAQPVRMLADQQAHRTWRACRQRRAVREPLVQLEHGAHRGPWLQRPALAHSTHGTCRTTEFQRRQDVCLMALRPACKRACSSRVSEPGKMQATQAAPGTLTPAHVGSSP